MVLSDTKQRHKASSSPLTLCGCHCDERRTQNLFVSVRKTQSRYNQEPQTQSEYSGVNRVRLKYASGQNRSIHAVSDRRRC